MSDIELFFKHKNPNAFPEYCDFAAKLYKVLLGQDAFENGVRIENLYNTFSFLFPKGEIIIGNISPYPGASEKPTCYFAFKNGERYGITYFDIIQLCSWLQENWDDLIDGDKK